MITITRLMNCALLLVLTGIATVWLRVTIEPWLPTGDWHAMLTALFVLVLWPAFAWSLRSLARVDITNPYSMMWWW